MGITLIGLFSNRDRSKSSVVLIICALIDACWIISDAIAYTCNGPAYPAWFLHLSNLGAYILGGCCFTAFLFYTYFYYAERVKLNSLYFIVPIALESIRVLITVGYYLCGKIAAYENGYMRLVGGEPFLSAGIDIIVLAYIPIVAFIKRELVGQKVGILFSALSMAIIISTVISFCTGLDMITIVSSFSIITVIVLLQRRRDIEMLERINREQKNQIEQVSKLNAELASQMDIIQSMSKIYYSSYYIDIENDTFFELNSKEGVRDVIGVNGNAQQTMDDMCGKIIMPKYREAIYEFTRLSTLNDRMKGKSFITYEYEGTISGWSQAFFIPGPRDENGYFKHVIYAIRTIHDEKMREDRSNAIIEGLSQEYHTVCVVDKDTHLLKLVRSSGVSTIKNAIMIGHDYPDYDTALGMYIDSYVEPEDRERMRKSILLTEVLHQLEENNIYSVNYLRRDENGIVRYHQISFINADTESGSRQFVYAFRDIDKIVKEENSFKQELRDAKKAAEAANEAKTAFLNNMSHDIRTPMNAILGFANLIDREKENPEKVAEYLKKVMAAGQYLLTIINNVLDLASIESGKTTIDEECADISSDDSSAIPLFTTLFQEKNITFTYSQEIQHPYIMLDKTKTQQITVNLLSNALKYTPEGGTVSVVMTEEPCEREGYGTYVMKISDTGIGMSPEFAKKVFDSFTRERNTTESKIDGTGLGMAIVKQLVTLMGGTIEVESEVGKGTTFIVTLDHKIVLNPNEYAKNSHAHHSDIQKISGKRILLAEDNELNAEIALIVLQDAGLIVDWSRDGIECIKMLMESEPGYYDAILMDIQMPVLNGYDSAMRIRQMTDPEKAGIPIIAMTANAFEEDKKNAFAAGMNGHLAKPINIQELMQTLADLIL